MNYYLDLDFNNPCELIIEVNKEFNVDLTNPKVLKRLARIKKDKAKEIFENGKYNFEVFKYALEDYFKRKEEEKKVNEEPPQEEENLKADKSRVRNIFSNMFSLEFAM